MTNELDKHFGPKPAVSMPAAKRQTFRCEPRLVPLLDGLLAHKRMILGDESFRPHNPRSWIAAAKETAGCLDSYGVPEKEWADWLTYGLRAHNKNMLNAGKSPFVKDTRTLNYTVEGFVLHPDADSEKSRQRYVTGKYKDFWGNGEDDE